VTSSAEAFAFAKRLPALDGVRGLAILAVFFYHYAGGLSRNQGSLGLHILGSIFGFGWSGVDLFFVLSGFLITGILYDTQNDVGYYRLFYARRILRIFPIYYLLLLIFLVLTPFFNLHWQWPHLWFIVYLGYPAALIWPTLITVSPHLLFSHLWSLSVEEQFYMLWPFAIIVICTVRRTVAHSDPVILTVGLTVLGLGSSAFVILAAKGGGIASLLACRGLRIFGKYSYGLYLYHFPLSVILSPGRERLVAASHSMIFGSCVFIVASLGINLLVAAASFHIIESPLLNLKKKFDYKSVVISPVHRRPEGQNVVPQERQSAQQAGGQSRLFVAAQEELGH
jgi:peptidoglycan/LPS O-acetylase OafA/YrhL